MNLKFCSNHFIFGDLEKELREEIIDAFQDVRVSPGTEVIKQGDVADYFYIIVRRIWQLPMLHTV
jgi:CRP-like cAMP-binding protein